MKKMWRAMSMGLVAVAVLGGGAAGAVPLVELKPDCGYVFNAFTGTPPGFDAMSQQLVTVLQMAGVSFPLPSWEEADLERVNGEVVGDGIPDSYQMAMLGAGLCAGDPVLLSQFAANKAQFADQVAGIVTLINAGTPLPGLMTPAISPLETWADGLPDGTWEQYEADDLIYCFQDSSEGIESELGLYGGMIVNLLPQYANWFAAVGGLDSGLRDVLNYLLSDLYENFTSGCGMKPASQGRLSWMAYMIDDLLQYADPPMPPDLAAQCQVVRDRINNVVLPAIAALHMPDMVLYGVEKKHMGGKTSPEPFAADGDYNGDGITNRQAYDLVTAADGDRFVFVQAAASANPFWPGNPGLPAMGGLGLAAIAAACAVIGIKKSRRS